jgi:hypothetical protein
LQVQVLLCWQQSKPMTHFKGFRIELQPPNFVATIYDDGAECRVWPIDNDKFYGDLLGITPLQHKLLHEIVHQCLAIGKGLDTCPIVRSQALLEPMPEGADQIEHEIMALSFLAMKKPMYSAGYWEAVAGLMQSGVDVSKVCDMVNEIFNEMKIMV